MKQASTATPNRARKSSRKRSLQAFWLSCQGEAAGRGSGLAWLSTTNTWGDTEAPSMGPTSGAGVMGAVQFVKITNKDESPESVDDQQA